jgi:uncharacterized membrane protein YdbT with pleckstrin-like domain
MALESQKNYDEWIWDNPNFPNRLSSDEDLLLLIRKDIAILIFRAIGLYLIFFAFLVGRLFVSGLSDWLIYGYEASMWTIAVLLILNFTLYFHNYFLSLQIITTHRIIDIDQRGLFNREINSTPIENIEDVTYKKNTLIKTLLNFGNVILQTAGESVKEAKGQVSGIVFNNVPNPSAVTHLISKVQNQKSNNEAKEQAELEAKALQKVLRRKTME